MNILKIYKTQLTPARNALLDNIEAYLEAIENPPAYYTGKDELTYVDNDFQFIKPDLDITIKINLPRNNNNLFDSIGNYAKVEQKQDDGFSAVWYYFIIGSRWTAQSTLELSLSLDTINTFGEYLLNSDNWSDKTNITREHKDRFTQLRSGNFIKKVDRVSEEITVPYLIKQNDTIIEEPNSSGTPEWYLVYKTANAAISEGGAQASENNLKCYVYPKTKIPFQQTPGGNAVDFIKTPADFEPGKIYGIITGGVQFNDILIRGKYQNSGGIFGSTLYWGHDENDQYNGWSEVRITGRVRVGDTFERLGVNYTCYAVVWYKNTDLLGEGYLNLPIGLFRSNEDDKTYYCIYVNTFNEDIINKYVFIGKAVGQIWGDFAQAFFEEPVGPGVVGDDSAVYWWSLYNDTTTTEDGIFSNRNIDTNWARNGIIFNEGNLQFDNEVPYICAIEYENKTPTVYQLNAGSNWYINGSAGITNYLASLDTIDRTDSKLVKIIALPYCPTAITVISGSLNSDNYIISYDPNILTTEIVSIGEVNYTALYYNNLSKAFGKDLLPIDFDFAADNSILEYYYNNEISERNMANEPKLQHSTFYKDTFVYDNVNKVIRREDIDANDKLIRITPYYQPTNTLTSTILFDFNIDNASYTNITDWDQVLISTRSNELPIYNNDYLNYMRYGYGAEKSALESTAEAQRQAYTTDAVLGIAGGTVGGALSGAAIGAKFGGVGAVPGAIVGAVVGLVSSIAKTSSAINTTETNIANAQRSLAAKVDEKRNSAATVQSGFSSVDLMSKYTGNRLHLMTYDTPEILKDAVYDRLYYCGYASPTQGKPVLDSRLLFNFIQADPTFIDESTNVYNYYLADIKDRFNTGITIYHDVSEYLPTLDTTELMYDFKQQFENWETFEKILPDNYTVSNLTFAGPYVRTITHSETEYTSKFIPSSNNNYRYKLTYTLPGNEIEYEYPYASAFDLANGYTLSTQINYTDFTNRNINVENGTIISVRLTDISGEWADSEPVYLTVNNTIKTSEGSFIPYIKYDGYYIWRSLNNSDYYYASTSLTPTRGSEVYEAYQHQDDTWEIDFGANHTITSAEGFSR